MIYNYDLTFYNDYDQKSPCVVTNQREIGTIPEGTYELEVTRFSINNKLIPVFLPEIRKPKNDMFSNLSVNLINSNYPYTKLSPVYSEFNKNFYQQCFQICIETIDVNGLRTYYGSYLPFIPENISMPMPQSCEKEVVVKNDYYYCYSLDTFANTLNIVLDNIINALPLDYKNILTGLDVNVIESGNITFMFPETSINTVLKWRIVVNQDLYNMLGFKFNIHEVIPSAYILSLKPQTMQLIPVNTFALQTINYCQLTENFVPSHRFPWKTLNLNTNLNVIPYNKYNTKQVMNNNSTEKLLIDYMFCVQNTDTFPDVIYYAPAITGRKTILECKRDENLISITASLETRDGYTSSLYLLPDTSASILLKLTEI